jgi:hypothetical protein
MADETGINLPNELVARLRGVAPWAKTVSEAARWAIDGWIRSEEAGGRVRAANNPPPTPEPPQDALASP